MKQFKKMYKINVKRWRAGDNSVVTFPIGEFDHSPNEEELGQIVEQVEAQPNVNEKWDRTTIHVEEFYVELT